VKDPQTEVKTSEDSPKSKNFACWGCGETEHSLRTCPRKTAEEKKQLWDTYGKAFQKSVRPIQEKHI